MDIETDLKEAGEILHAEAVFARQPWIHQDLRHSYHKPRGGHSRNRHVEGAEMTLVGCWSTATFVGWFTSNLFGWIHFCYVQIEFNIGMTPCIRLDLAENPNKPFLDKNMIRI